MTDIDYSLLFALADQADAVQRCATSLADLSASFAEFLISRSDFAHALACSSDDLNLLLGLRADHEKTLQRLRRSCERLKAQCELNSRTAAAAQPAPATPWKRLTYARSEARSNRAPAPLP